jgi:hypothetical protein
MDLFSQEELSNSKFNEFLKVKCDVCGQVFQQRKRSIIERIKRKSDHCACSKKCISKIGLLSNNLSPSTVVNCKTCNVAVLRIPSQIKKYANHFCSRSCSATYSNTHKSKGTRRSKLEKWLEVQLHLLYPNLDIWYSNKSAINSELDIYIPFLNLAFELNGIFHYEPIFGDVKLNQIKNNDSRKFQACLERNIELCIIDTSQHKYVKPSTSQKYLDIITHLVNSKLESSKTDYVEVV